MENIAVIVYVVVSLIVIGVLMTFLILCEKKKCDNFCVCKGAGQKICRDLDKVRKEYRENKATEYSTRPEKQWSKYSPGDYTWEPPQCGQKTSDWKTNDI